MVSPSAAINGSYGLLVQIQSNTPAYLLDASPQDEVEYRARFYFNHNSISMGNNDTLDIFTGGGPDNESFRLELRYFRGGYDLRASAANSRGRWQNTNYIPLSDAPVSIELLWRASAPGTNSGALALWIEGVLVREMAGIDNAGQSISQVKLGAVSGIGNTTRGSYLFDDFVSRRPNYIGP
jgi:hypothetical protein